jgi:RNA polymerase sigma-70 factor (ECF subfamily)
MSGRDRGLDEARFDCVFAHLDAVARYARRRGSQQPEDVAAECMAIAWRRLDDVPADDPLPWLYGCARRLLLTEWRARARVADGEPPETAFAGPDVAALDEAVARALRTLAPSDREALLLIAWEGLTPAQAAHALGIGAVAFRVRLHRARRRCAAALAAAGALHARPEATRDPEASHA